MNHKDLDAWKNSMLLAERLYIITKDFPQHEQFGITSQIRRAAVSVPANLSEGSGRSSRKEFVRFLDISMGSLAELETLIILSNKIEYINETNKKEILELITKCNKLIHGLIRNARKDL